MALPTRLKALLVVPPIAAIGAIVLFNSLNDREQGRLDQRQLDCEAKCLETRCKQAATPPAGRRPIPAGAVVEYDDPKSFDPREWLCLNNQDVASACVRGNATGYDRYGIVAASAIGIVWGPWALWMLILAMIRSVIRTVQEAKKPDR